MTPIRLILLVTMTALILPWHAYARSAAVGPVLPAWYKDAPGAQGALWAVLDRDMARVADRSCRGEAAFGAPCGLDLAMLPRPVVLGPDARSDKVAGFVRPGATRRIAWAVWDPPRR